MSQAVSIIGQGYVGLPLAIACAKSGFKVTGIDINSQIVEKLNNGESTIEDIPSLDIQEVLSAEKYLASVDYTSICNADTVIVCVPTPLNSKDKPDLSHLESAVKNLAQFLKEGALVIIESTIAPETTRKILWPLIQNHVQPSDTNFHLAFSPERIDPSNKEWNISNTPKLVAGLDDLSCELACKFYSNFIKNIVKCSSLEIAETAKLLENSFRFINITFINQIAKFCNELGINVNDVINAASTKPYGFTPFYPSAGVGGHCIPVDPIYLSNKAKELGSELTFIDLAELTNSEMPLYFAERAVRRIGNLKNKSILIVGVAYKPNVSDVRQTPVEPLISELRSRGAQVVWHDDLVGEWKGEKSVVMSENYDLAILATIHSGMNLGMLGNAPVLDTRNSI
jgi:UDP-N-acetyl-D-glucosamine dehydrogenase